MKRLGMMPVVTLAIALVLSGCAAQWVNDAKPMDVNGRPYFVSSQSTSGSCTEVTTSYLFNEKSELIESAIQSARGTTLFCAVMQAGAQSGPIGAGLARSGSTVSANSSPTTSSEGGSSVAGSVATGGAAQGGQGIGLGGNSSAGATSISGATAAPHW